MRDDQESSGEPRNHLLVTASFAVKGSVQPLGGRLGDHLRSWRQPFLHLVQARVTTFGDGATSEFARLTLPVDGILLAHEYVAMSGDPHLQSVHASEPPTPARILIGGATAIQVEGALANGALESRRRFLVLIAPKIQALMPAADALARAVEGLPYLLLNRDRMDALMSLEP